MKIYCVLDSLLKFECTGCILPNAEADYYCPEVTDLFYFRCRIYNSTSLVWNLLNYRVPLNPSTLVDNVIRKGSDVTVLVERIMPDENGITANFSSHLWIDFKELPQGVSSFNVTCGNQSLRSQKQLKALGEVYISPKNFNYNYVFYLQDPYVVLRILIQQQTFSTLTRLLKSVLCTMSGITLIQNRFYSTKLKYFTIPSLFIK